MSKIEKICHLADIQIRKSPKRNEEYEEVFDNLIKSLNEKKPDRIVIVGDLFQDYLDLQGEQLIVVSKLLNNLSKIAPVRITRGNHDCRKKALNRVDSIKAIVEVLNNPNIVYYDKTGLFYDENVVWAVWHHGEKNNNPWKTKEGKEYEKNKDKTHTSIDLFHETVNGCKTLSGLEMKSNSYYKTSDFKGDLSFYGHIHKLQYLDKNKTKAYCSSLISQDFSEGDDEFHGYLMWNIGNKTAEEISIENNYSYKNIKITPFTDFDDLDFEISNPTKYMKIRFIWCTLSQTRNADAERKLYKYIKDKYPNIIISHKNEFIEEEKIDVIEEVTLKNIKDATVQHEIFKEFLTKIGTDEKMINDVITLDGEILNLIDIDESDSVEWDIIKFGGKNFMSYDELDIDWRDKDGLFQITGVNTGGKTTLMKLISYILFGIALETEKRKKFGDSRFVNNRNDATYCEAYMVIEANGEYYGIKKRTDITRSRDGNINGAPTSLKYYSLSTPDDEMNDESLIDNLTSDKRTLTQFKINNIIGSYDNFMRIVMTTSDTLNKILSDDMAEFIDSILFDAGLDIFDKKLEGFKVYQKRNNEKSRITCNVESVENQNTLLKNEIESLNTEIENIEKNTLPDLNKRINIGNNYIEDLLKKMFNINPEISNLNVDHTKDEISVHNNKIVDLKARNKVLEGSIKALKETYDKERLEFLLDKKDKHKNNEYTLNLKIKTIEQDIRDESHKIETINGDVVRLKTDGSNHRTNIQNLKDSRICPTCHQKIEKKEHQDHIDNQIKIIEKEMFDIADKIKHKENVEKPEHLKVIETKKQEIVDVENEIKGCSIEMDDVLKEIGLITNDKNDVEERERIKNELNQNNVKIQNEELNIKILQQKIDSYENSLKEIEENEKTQKTINAAKDKLESLQENENSTKNNLFSLKSQIPEKELKINNNKQLILDFKQQEYNDRIMDLYKKCVHRDGIPRQMLNSYILPKINSTLETILSVAPFKVWLDPDDLRPKLIYSDRPNAIIDCISASGKERTFASVVLKFALNLINVKAKPSIFLLDEVMGKFDDESAEEFNEILQLIKNRMKKVLVIEHVREINPDYIIKVELNDERISSAVLE